MKKQPIHQNLNTSFVNVAALVRYLRGLQFVGSIRIELSSYEADIIFTSSSTIVAREYDHIAGRISHGKHALQRILVRAEEPHGRIHVYKSVEGLDRSGSIFVDKAIAGGAREMAASTGGTASKGGSFNLVMSQRDGTNSLILGALSEMLRTIDESLAEERLSFSAAFRNSCEGVASEFPFMAEREKVVAYKNGEIRLVGKAEAASVAAAVFAALRTIFLRLRGEQKYTELFHVVRDKLRESSNARRSEYTRLGLMPHIEALLDEAD